MTDSVNHPKHYNLHPSGIECIDIIRHHNFNIGNVIKYLWRAGLKDTASTIEDLKKAAWYLNDEIKRLETEEAITLQEAIDQQAEIMRNILAAYSVFGNVDPATGHEIKTDPYAFHGLKYEILKYADEKSGNKEVY